MASENINHSTSRASSIDYDDFDDYDECISMQSVNSSCYSSHNCSFEIEKPLFMVLTSDDVASQMNAEINLINESLNLPPTVIRILFDRYKWDKQLLTEKYTAFDDDTEAFFREANIITPLRYNFAITTATCEICFDTREITGLHCGHKFCKSCWEMYLTLRINDGLDSTIPCAHSNCDTILEDVTVKNLVTNAAVISKYNRLICNSFVKWKTNLHWCPSPRCNFVIDIQSNDCKYVTCKCNCQFCCECYDEWHAPISCKLLHKWRCDDSATQDYLTLNTKHCPKCEWNIEKNGGCPHMTCKHCRHEFCWKCLKSWKLHNGDYICKSPEENEAIQKSRSLIQRLNYCWERYSYNKNALDEERKRYKLIWEEYEPQISDLKSRVDVLYDCRRFLMYAYAFIYYLVENNTVYMLESNLDCLEANTDKLTVSLENYLIADEFDEDRDKDKIRSKILDYAVHCDRLRKTWLSQIEMGHDEDTWIYRE